MNYKQVKASEKAYAKIRQRKGELIQKRKKEVSLTEALDDLLGV